MFEKHDTSLDKVFVTLVYASMFLLLVIMIYPFWDQLIMSVSMRTAALRGGFRLWTWPLNFEPYRSVFQSSHLLEAALNTVYRVVLGTVFTIVVTSLTSYPLSQDHFPLKGFFTAIILFTMLFSGGLIPSYLLRKQLNLLDKRLVLILPGIGAYNVIIMRNFFKSIPAEIQESARLDGASDVAIWARIIMPLSKPVLATIALWTAVGHWNAYFDSLIYITDRSKEVLQVVLRRALLEDELVSMGMQPGPELGNVMQRKPTNEMVKAALLMVTTLPIVMIYPFLQRYFIKGIMLGAVKG